MMFQEVEIDDRNWNNWNRVDTPTSIEIVRCILEWRWQGFMWIFLNSHLSKACEAKNMCNKLLANKLLVIAYYECKHILLIKIHLLWDFITVNNFIKYVTYVMWVKYMNQNQINFKIHDRWKNILFSTNIIQLFWINSFLGTPKNITIDSLLIPFLYSFDGYLIRWRLNQHSSFFVYLILFCYKLGFLSILFWTSFWN